MTDTANEVGNALCSLSNGDWMQLTLGNDTTIQRVMVVDVDHFPATEQGRYGNIEFAAEATDAERDRLDLPSCVLHIRAVECPSGEWERASVEVYGSGGGTEYGSLGEITAIERTDPPS